MTLINIPRQTTFMKYLKPTRIRVGFGESIGDLLTKQPSDWQELSAGTMIYINHDGFVTITMGTSTLKINGNHIGLRQHVTLLDLPFNKLEFMGSASVNADDFQSYGYKQWSSECPILSVGRAYRQHSASSSCRVQLWCMGGKSETRILPADFPVTFYPLCERRNKKKHDALPT